jgi:hypothetical protein
VGHFKVNTSKKQQYSLFRQGCDYYEFLPGMRDEWARPLLERFSELLSAQPLFTETLWSHMRGWRQDRAGADDRTVAASTWREKAQAARAFLRSSRSRKPAARWLGDSDCQFQLLPVFTLVLP